MNTDITASAKPEYPVIDQNPPFTKVYGNFNTLDYFYFTAITGIFVTVDYRDGPRTLGIKPGLKGLPKVTGGLIGLMGDFMYAYQNSAGRLMGFFPNNGEVAQYLKVLNVTKFLEEHPGGEEVLLESAGKDATKEFNDIGHSKTAMKLAFKYQVGVIQGYSSNNNEHVQAASTEEPIKREMGAFIIGDEGKPEYAGLLEFICRSRLLLPIAVTDT